MGELRSWLQQYQEENHVDLVINKVNGHRSRQLFNHLLDQLAAGAAATRTEERMAAEALAACQDTQQQQSAGSPMSE